MFNKSFSILTLLGSLTFGTHCFAQAIPTPVDIAHDQPANDPSDPKRVLRLKEEIPQKDFAIKGTLKQLAKSSLHGLNVTLNPFAGYEVIQKIGDPDFEEILNHRSSMFDLFYAHQDRRTPKKENGPKIGPFVLVKPDIPFAQNILK